MRSKLLRSRAVVVLFSVIVGATAVGSVSYELASAAGGPNPTFFGCASSAGAIRAASIHVGSPPTCKSTETLQSWDAQGPTGSQGPVGQASIVRLLPAVQCPTPPGPPSPGAPANGAFLNVANIPGESTDALHPNEIDVVSWSWGVSNGGTTGQACGAAASTSTLLDLTVVKNEDKASPKFMLANAQGNSLGTIVLSLEKQGTDYLVLTLDNAIVSSYKIEAGGGDLTPHEQVTFAATRITYSYRQQLTAGGFANPLVTCFDSALQVSC